MIFKPSFHITVVKLQNTSEEKEVLGRRYNMKFPCALHCLTDFNNTGKILFTLTLK